MAYVISDECISCGACAADCPCEAISEGAEHYEIDADKCVDCGACAAGCAAGLASSFFLPPHATKPNVRAKIAAIKM